MRYFIVFSLLFSSLDAKECYKNKLLDKTICYYKYHDRDKIYKPQNEERYYQTKNGSIYAISDKIEIKFHALGAILTVLDDFEVDFRQEENLDMGDFRIGFNEYDLQFFDKTRNDKFIFRVKKPEALFIILRKLNELENVKSAEPIIKRKFTHFEIRKRLEKAKEKQEDIEKSLSAEKAKKKKSSSEQGFQGGNFLKGGVQK